MVESPSEASQLRRITADMVECASKFLTPMDFCHLLRGLGSTIETLARTEGLWDPHYYADLAAHSSIGDVSRELARLRRETDA
jgi:hypothetical protein